MDAILQRAKGSQSVFSGPLASILGQSMICLDSSSVLSPQARISYQKSAGHFLSEAQLMLMSIGQLADSGTVNNKKINNE